MSGTSSATKTTPTGIERGKKYRFVVSSAEEAISTLRERLGMEAKVLSVKQVDGQGLSRFLKSPKLEIIATVPEQEALPPPQAEESARPKRTRRQPETAQAEPLAPVAQADPQRGELEAELAAEAPLPKAPARGAPYAGASRRRQPSDVWTVLRNAGFDETLLSSLRYDAGSSVTNIDELPLQRALGEVNRRLRLEYQSIDTVPATERIAFFGTPGVGKTTALCKRLANDVFLRRKNVEVLKLDSDTPNPDDALSLFCDVLGVPMTRDSGQDQIETQADMLYVDLPGLPMGEREQWMPMRKRLDALDVRTRVLVVNAMYEAGLISAAFDLGEMMGATHLVVTHMDELVSAAKLWPFVLRGRLSPLFASHGQNVTSDYAEDILRLLLEKTFPANIIN
ncbi:MAG: hypothetical protein WC360_01960 [Opitutales bacterium]